MRESGQIDKLSLKLADKFPSNCPEPDFGQLRLDNIIALIALLTGTFLLVIWTLMVEKLTWRMKVFKRRKIRASIAGQASKRQ